MINNDRLSGPNQNEADWTDGEEPSLDPYLKGKLDEYQEWLDEGLISYSSRVIPIRESLEINQWILPSEQALEILKGARTIAVQDCVCRSRYQRCDHPLEVCFLLNETSDQYVEKGEARRISLPEAVEILKAANQAGLVHLSLYMPDHEIFALCSCCSCCCHDFQLVRTLGRKDLMVRSEYAAFTDQGLCVDCGDCVDRCVFQARILEKEQLELIPEACMGCGLCVTICDQEAIQMISRDDQSQLDS